MPGVIYGDYGCVIASESNMLKFLSRGCDQTILVQL